MTYKLPEWNNEGIEPPQTKKDEGWKPTEKPPAEWFNWLFRNTYEALKDHLSRLDDHDLTLANKVDKVSGKQLSTEDYTTAEKEKVAILQTADSVTDEHIGDRTIDQSVAPPTGAQATNTGKLGTILNWIANLIKGITGKSDWRTAPRTTLENAVKRDGDSVTNNITFTSDNTGVILSSGGKLYDQAGPTQRTVVQAAGDVLEVIKEDGSDYVFRANYASPAPSFKGKTLYHDGLTYTANQATAPTGAAGTLEQFVSWFANRIKAITGKTNWYDAPSISLETVNERLGQAVNTDSSPTFVGLITTGGAVRLANGFGIQGKDTAGTYRTIGYINAADQVSLGNPYNTMALDTKDVVGIGRASAASGLAAGRKALAITGASDQGVIEVSTGAAEGANVGLGYLVFADRHITAAERRVAGIAAVTEGATANNRGGALQFLTKADNTAVWGEKMRLTNVGRLGLNTQAPVSLLHVNGGAMFNAANGGTEHVVITSNPSTGFKGGLMLTQDASYSAITGFKFNVQGTGTLDLGTLNLITVANNDPDTKRKSLFTADARGPISLPSQSGCRVSLSSTALTVPANTSVKIPFSKEWDNLGEWDNANARFVAKVSGRYLITASVEIYGNGVNNNFSLFGNIDGNVDKYLDVLVPSVNSYQSLSGSTVVDLGAGQSFYLYIYGNGIGCSVNPDVKYTHMSIQKIA